jgi:hypothetical protein
LWWRWTGSGVAGEMEGKVAEVVKVWWEERRRSTGSGVGYIKEFVFGFEDFGNQVKIKGEWFTF